jgi:hypothetical protein
MKVRYILLTLLLFEGCGDILFDLRSAIQQFGYIAYTTPLQYAGTGTLVSGDAAHLEVLSSPESCFPNTMEVNGEKTNLRKTDNTTLPSQSKTVTVDAYAMANFFNMMQVGTPSIKASTHIQDVKKFTFSFSGAQIEYIDLITLQSYYPNMKESCKTYLDLVGFIIQAVRIDSMSFTFYEKSDSQIKLDVEKIKQLLDIAVNVSWHIENEVKLVIDSPKYIGYQLGSLRKEDNGLSLYRATSTIIDKFIFKKIAGIPHDRGLVVENKEIEVQQINSEFPEPKNPLQAVYGPSEETGK